MNTTQLKRFATEARNKLREGVKGRLIKLGFDIKSGDVPEAKRPTEVQGGGSWMGRPVSTAFVRNWNDLYHHTKQIGINQMIEEGAYTWFNRLVAIRILAKNNLCAPVLQFVDTARTPLIVDEARKRISYSEYRVSDDGHSELTFTMDGQTYKLYDINYSLFEDDSKTSEQFAVLINAWVNNNAIISACFGGATNLMNNEQCTINKEGAGNPDGNESYSLLTTPYNLLLPDDVLSEGGFLTMLNGADFISDEDYHSPELIGWLYQFYISEKKDQVFAKKGKYDADEIPAATQIFTPNWIVKYMVQNAVLPQVISSSEYRVSELREKYKYLVLPPANDSTPDGPLLTTNYSLKPNFELEEFKVADLACGSGHILNECFDLLYELYIHEGYSRREAITNIFEHNLTGIDIDLRAKQLATFALLLKACQRDASFADAHCLPKVLSVPTMTDIVRDPKGYLPHFFLGTLSSSATDELCEAWKDIKNADELGSIIKFDISDSTRRQIKEKVEEWRRQDFIPQGIQDGLPIMDFILALTEQYDALVMNPPYMGSGSMPPILSDYVKKNYPEGKGDMFAVFIQQSQNILKRGGLMGLVTMESWMFLSSFEKLRQKLLKETTIVSLTHLDWHIMHIAFGTVTFILRNKEYNGEIGVYSYLYRTEVDLDKDMPYKFPNKDNGRFREIPQTNFDKIPGSPIGYWVSEKMIALFQEKMIYDIAYPRLGMATADNNLFTRYIWEISQYSIFSDCSDCISSLNSKLKWYPYAKGGVFRKWYGNKELVVNWMNNGFDIQNFRDNNGKVRSHNYNLDFIFKKGITWNALSSSNTSFRVIENSLFDNAGSSCFLKDDNDYFNILGYLNSCLVPVLSRILNPTLNYQPGTIGSLPALIIPVAQIVEKNITISKEDWDAHETSWDFQENEIVGLNTADKYVDLVNGIYEGIGIMVDLEAPKLDSLEWRTGLIKDKWTNKFNRLHDNEVELNRRFIEIYGLQDELTPDVPLDEVTILQQGEISIKEQLVVSKYTADDENRPTSAELQPDGTYSLLTTHYNLNWNNDVLMKQLISYAVGCMMGRYRLDRPGLAIAHPNPTAEEIAPYEFNGETFEIDDDAIIPLMPADCGFYDNATQRLSDFVRQVFGEQSQAENLNYIEKCLGKTIEQYFIKDFWKDHKKMYQNRPIYWLFSSKKGAFQVIAYMHRMTPYTVERIRAKYLLPYIETLNSRKAKLAAREAELSTTERKQLDALGKQLEECREYHDRLAVVAEQAIAFDLDDGIPHNHAKFGDVVAKLK